MRGRRRPSFTEWLHHWNHHVSWVATPHFYLMGSVIAIYVGDNQAVLGPLQAVMGAQFAGG